MEIGQNVLDPTWKRSKHFEPLMEKIKTFFDATWKEQKRGPTWKGSRHFGLYMERIQTFWALHEKGQIILDATSKGSKMLVHT